MADRREAYPHFRLNFEQQQKRAKELLRAARAGDGAALARFKSPPKLAEAQYLIARELRFPSWAQLKRHIAAMTREREALEAGSAAHTAPVDGDLRTLHVRCGSDIREELQRGGFRGDFCEHSYPYLIGPVREGPGSLEQRARFLVESYGASCDPPLEHEPVLEGLRRDEERLRGSADYERVVIWSERDCYDQLVLVRLLSHYALARRPPRLELINVGTFPGAARFIGLGQLPIGGLVQVLPSVLDDSLAAASANLEPYPPLELIGRDVYIREGCSTCHSQQVRPLLAEVKRYGPYSRSDEFAYDRPFLWGSKRTGPDLARLGGKYTDDWHRVHMTDPRAVVPASIMPAYPWLAARAADAGGTIARRLRTLQALGHPYSDEEIDAAPAALADKTELDALIAYLQSLGTALDETSGDTHEGH